MSERSFPWSGFVLALVACVTLLMLGVDLAYVCVVLLVWVGSLYLVTARPPEPKEAPTGRAFSRDNMADLFEHSETPVVITERDRVIIANLSARTLLGGHIVGQDVRMALRQPEAIRLLARDTEGSAVVRGLTRRTDIWRIHLKKRNRNPDDFDLYALAMQSDRLSGAEIEQALIASLYEAFDQNRPLTMDDLEHVLGETIPLSTMMSEDIDALRAWSKGRARNAT